MTPTTFSFPAYRQLCQSMGATDAMVELSELATRVFLKSARLSGDVSKYVSTASAEQRIYVNVAEVDLVSRHLARSYIVTVYTAAECFLLNFRREHIALYEREWKGDGCDVDPFTVALRNITADETNSISELGIDLVGRFQYYRIVRNWVVHAKTVPLEKVQATYDALVEYSPENKKTFGALGAPHPPESLDFDDFILFSRLTKQLAEGMCRVCMPQADYFVHNMPTTKYKSFQGNPKRMRSSISVELQTKYGMDKATTDWIAEEFLAHWRSGSASPSI